MANVEATRASAGLVQAGGDRRRRCNPLADGSPARRAFGDHASAAEWI